MYMYKTLQLPIIIIFSISQPVRTQEMAVEEKRSGSGGVEAERWID